MLETCCICSLIILLFQSLSPVSVSECGDVDNVAGSDLLFG